MTLHIRIQDTAEDHFVVYLKVHKIENFFDSDFEICVISLLVIINNKVLVKHFFDWTIMGGATIIPRSLKTTRNEKTFKIGQSYFFIS